MRQEAKKIPKLEHIFESVNAVFESGMFILDPGSWFPVSRTSDHGSRIPDPKTATKEKGEKILSSFFLSPHITKFKLILFLTWWRKKFGPIYKDLSKFLPKTLSLSSHKYSFGSGIPDPRSGIRKNLFRIPDPNPQHCVNVELLTWNIQFVSECHQKFSWPKPCQKQVRYITFSV